MCSNAVLLVILLECWARIFVWIRRGVGCIFHEMSSGRPLFPGSTIEDELRLICSILGPPPDELKSKLEFCITPVYPSESKLQLLAPEQMDSDALDLVQKFLMYDAKQRISAANAMRHPYFNSLGPQVHELSDTQSIFSLPHIKLTSNPTDGGLLPFYGQKSEKRWTGLSRRQSMLLWLIRFVSSQVGDTYFGSLYVRKLFL